MNSFNNSDAMDIVLDMVSAIQQNKNYLSEIDGLIGDGDHGINMNKGFSLCAKRLESQNVSFTKALEVLGNVLFSEIGGSMGPLYGSLFMDMADAAEDAEVIMPEVFCAMITAGYEGIKEITEAQVGDKTLIDVLAPSKEAFCQAVAGGKTFSQALRDLKKAAVAGRDSTIDMVAKLGRASRLGERSRGVLDVGATSCSLLLCTMADAIIKKLG